MYRNHMCIYTSLKAIMRICALWRNYETKKASFRNFCTGGRHSLVSTMGVVFGAARSLLLQVCIAATTLEL